MLKFLKDEHEDLRWNVTCGVYDIGCIIDDGCIFYVPKVGRLTRENMLGILDAMDRLEDGKPLS